MKASLKYFFVLACLNLFLICGCGGSGTTPPPSDTYQVVVFSDVHFTPYYDPSLFDDLLHTGYTEWADIFGHSMIAEPPAWGSETNYPLLLLALSSVKTSGAASPVVIFTGDILTHYFDDTFYELYGIHDETEMRAFAYKTVAFFTSQVRSYLGDIPVMFVLGNNDAYEGDYLIEPNGAFLADTAEIFYTDLLNGTADEATFMNTYRAGGYYAAEPLGTNLVVIGLNSIFFSDYAAPGIESDVEAELTWLDTTLAAASAAGKKVWLLMHIPPGGNIFSIKNHIDAEGHITDAAMMWKETYQETFSQIVANYSSIITMSLAGHTHMDEYRLPAGFLEVTPAISPIFRNDPAYKIFTFPNGTFAPTDYVALNYDLSSITGDFANYYTFTTAYSMQGILDTALATLYATFPTDTAKQTSYRNNYYSGHDSASPINDLNWPVYWCGIGEMIKDDLINCVNGY